MAKRVALTVLLCAMLIGILIVPVFAHSGGTDADGGHYDSSTGQYHYHCGGHPAHQHRYGVCPYEGNNSYENDEEAGGGGLLYSALVAGTAGAIVCGVMMLIKRAKRKKRDKKEQNEAIQIKKTNQSVKTQATIKKDIAPAPLMTAGDKISLEMSRARKLAEEKNVLLNFERNQKYLKKMMVMHYGKNDIIKAEVYYFIYGIHEIIEEKFKGVYFGDLFSNIEFVGKIHMPIISIIVDTPPKGKIKISEYADMICELFFAQSDAELLGIFDKYEYEYPDRIKKLLSNDIDVLAETAFYSVAMTVQTSNVNYLNKGIMSADFILYCYALYRSVVFSSEINAECKKHFEKTLKQHFVEYCEMMRMFNSKTETIDFFYDRYGKYSKLITIENDESTLDAMDELLSFAKQETSLHDNEEIAFIRESAALMARLNEEAKPYFDRMLDEYERMSAVSYLNNAISVIEEEIEYREKQDQ